MAQAIEIKQCNVKLEEKTVDQSICTIGERVTNVASQNTFQYLVNRIRSGFFLTSRSKKKIVDYLFYLREFGLLGDNNKVIFVFFLRQKLVEKMTFELETRKLLGFFVDTWQLFKTRKTKARSGKLN